MHKKMYQDRTKFRVYDYYANFLGYLIVRIECHKTTKSQNTCKKFHIRPKKRSSYA